MSRKERLKVYHGVPKNIIDENTIFYASFDGSDVAEVGGAVNLSGTKTVTKSPTGYGLIVGHTNSNQITNPKISNLEGTLEFFVDMDSCTSDGWIAPVTFCAKNSKANSLWFLFKKSTGYIHLRVSKNESDLDFRTIDFSKYMKQCPIIHFRCCWNYKSNYVKMYVNGNLLHTETYSTVFMETDKINIGYTKYYGYASSDSTIYGASISISDIRISDIDRGDYFSNLPQDFIDGKAIIKHRMGQQQIKGDPMYNQETTDIVKIGANVNEPYITCSRTSGSWTNGDTIKIKGLSEEIISGVIDTDTALCKVAQATVKSGEFFTVSDVSKLTVGDRINLYVPPNIYFIKDRTITDIDVASSSIKVNPTIGLNGDGLSYYIVETTTTTSSPTVKTSDETNITGTWSNLGTNEATFTLGTNATLTNQDLYVTYSLNIPQGNSDFTELPYKIEKVYDEVGNELEEVSDLIIEDDFNGKVSGSVKECPHRLIWNFGSDKNADISTYVELGSTLEYYDVYTCNDTPKIFNTTTNTWSPLVIAEFDILQCIKTKLNTTDLSLIDNIRIYVNASATNKSNTNLDVSLYKYTTSSWATGWITNNSNTFIEKSNIISNNVLNDYIKNGKVMIRFTTDASNGVTPSIVNIDYVKVEIKLKTDSTFATFYSKNKRAREIPCNPVLIQKETKTVKRYLPSKECFVTESSYVKFKGTSSKQYSLSEILAIKDNIQLNSMGTGKFIKPFDEFEMVNSLCFVTKKPTYTYIGEKISNKEIYKGYLNNSNLNYEGGTMYVPRQFTFANRHWANLIDIEQINASNFMQLFPHIVKKDGEVGLCLINTFFTNKKYSTEETYYFPLPNRPLIKEK